MPFEPPPRSGNFPPAGPAGESGALMLHAVKRKRKKSYAEIMRERAEMDALLRKLNAKNAKPKVQPQIKARVPSTVSFTPAAPKKLSEAEQHAQRGAASPIGGVAKLAGKRFGLG